VICRAVAKARRPFRPTLQVVWALRKQLHQTRRTETAPPPDSEKPT
jgi:hypothetical protein